MLVDDHKVVRDGLALVLGLSDEVEVVASAGSAAEGIAQLRRMPVDVVVMDMVMPGLDGVQATEIVRREHPNVEVLMLTSFQEQAPLRAAMERGARGLLLKSVSGDELVVAIVAAAKGRSTIDPELIPGLFGPSIDPPGASEMTERERQVLNEMANGDTNRQIGHRLGISPGTVRVHVSSILAKLGAANRTEAVAVALRHGLIEDDIGEASAPA
ncbi:MAG: response regulator transcription factor [Jiangellales bacterium]